MQHFKIDLRDEIRSWLLLRHAGLNEEHKTLVMSQVGTKLMFERVVGVLQSTFGQQHVLTDGKPRRLAVHWTDEVENDRVLTEHATKRPGQTTTL